MGTTEPKSIFDIPKPLLTSEEIEALKPKRKKRSKTPKRKKPKVAKAGGVEVSQKTSVNGRKQLTLKHKGGLTQEITIYTGEQKPRGHKAKGQTANWNMKPAKFKKSRGLRDDRVYLQPPKREYFGNRYKSAMDKIKIDQKVKDAGASKNKEIADVRTTATKQKKELERREAIKDDTISELKREKAGIVASHNVSQRNQSRATILGGDVGELNKLINRRGYAAIRQLVIKGEITDDSTILQLDLTQAQIDRLLKLRSTEQSEFVDGRKYVYITPKGLTEEGAFISETASKIRLRKEGGGIVVVPKTAIQSGKEVSESRARSSDPAVRIGTALPRTESFGSPRKRTASEERERPAHRRDRKRASKTPREAFVKEASFDLSESSSEGEATNISDVEVLGAISKLRKTLRTPTTSTTKTSFTARDRPDTPAIRIDPSSVPTVSPEPRPFGRGKSRTPEEEEELERLDEVLTRESPISVGGSGSSEESEGAEVGVPTPEPEPEPKQLELILEDSPSERRAEFLEEGDAGGGSVRTSKLGDLIAAKEDRFPRGLDEDLTIGIPRVKGISIGESGRSITDSTEGQSLLADLDRMGEGKNILPAEELGRRLKKLGVKEDTYYWSQWRTFAPRDQVNLQSKETPREFFQSIPEGKRQSRSRSRSASASPRPPQSPAVKKAGAAVTAEVLRRQRSGTPPTTFLSKSNIKETGFSVVDNRPERSKGKGRELQRPLKEYSFDSIESEIRNVFASDDGGLTKTGVNQLAKLEKSRTENKAFYTNNGALLKALGFRDA